MMRMRGPRAVQSRSNSFLGNGRCSSTAFEAGLAKIRGEANTLIFQKPILTNEHGDSIMKTTAAFGIAVAVAFQIAMLLAQDPGGMQATDQQKHHEIMPIHAKIIEKQKAQDAEIDKLLAEMSSATGEKRID